MSTTLFEDFVNAELPLRIGTVEVTPPSAGELPAYKGVGLLTEHKTLAQLNISSTQNLSTDGTFASPSGTTYPSTLAVKTLVDARTAGLLELCSASYDASSNLYPSTGGSGAAGAIVKGDVFFIGTGGVLGGVTVNTGDGVVALVDSPAQTASNWDVFESNLGYTPENQSNKDSDGTLSANSDTKYPTQKAVKTYADTKQLQDWTAYTTYTLNKPVMHQNQQFVCTTAHTSSGSFDYIQFSPISGVLDVAIASGTFTPYANANIKSYNIRATGSFTMNLALADTRVFAQVVNVTTSGVSLTITSSQILAEGHVGAASTTPITLSCGEGVSAYNLNNNGTTYFQRINSYKQPAALATFYKSGSQTVGATFDASALTAAKTMTLPNGDVWLNELPHLYAISSGTIAWKTGFQPLKPSFIFASDSFTIDLDLTPTVGVVPFDIVNISTGTITVTLIATYAFSSASSNTGSPISLLAGERVTCTNYDSGSLTWYFRKQGAVSSAAHALYDNTTPSKRLVHAISAIAASTTRTVTWPNADVNMGKVTGHLTAVSNLAVGASPFTYQNATVYQEDILITGGTVSLVEFTRDNVTWYTLSGEMVSLSPSDRVRVTYSSTPTMTKIPR